MVMSFDMELALAIDNRGLRRVGRAIKVTNGLSHCVALRKQLTGPHVNPLVGFCAENCSLTRRTRYASSASFGTDTCVYGSPWSSFARTT